MNDSKQILIFGHSHARRLGEFMQYREAATSRLNFGFSYDKVQITCKGIGGLRLRQLIDSSARSKEFDNIMKDISPQALILCLGDNDIKKSSSAEEISSYIEVISSILKKKYPCIQQIIFTQLLPRHDSKKYGKQSNYNRQANQVNTDLKNIAKHCPYIFFRWCDFYFPQENVVSYNSKARLFLKDGVHLSHTGYYKLYKSLRHAIINFLKV